MRYVVVERQADGFWLDPDAYLNVIPELLGELPLGAGAFAADPDHFNFGSRRCVKDLALDSLKTAGAEGELLLRFLPNPFKHDESLHIRYAGVKRIEVECETPGPGHWLGTVMLDELIPSDTGVSHELRLTTGTIRIHAADLIARWVTDGH